MRVFVEDGIIALAAQDSRDGKPCFDTAAPLARSRGAVRVGFKRFGERTVFDDLYQSGCLRLRMPRRHAGDIAEGVIINTSGGLTGGDRIDFAARWGRGAAVCVCSQAAEKIYRALAGEARISNRLDVAEGSEAEWLPQETILFNGAALDRRLDVHVEARSTFLGLEGMVLGRTAMREEVTSGRIRDAWRIFRDGKLIYADVFRLEGNIAARLDRAALGAGARAFATIIFAAQTIAEDLLENLREALKRARGRAAASLWNGILAARFLAPEGETLRHDVVLALNVLRNGRALPRVWQC